MFEFETSISITWFLTGTISFDFGVAVNSITLETTPLIFDIEATFNEFKVT